MSRSDGYGYFGRDKKWYKGDVPSHTQTWYNNAPCSNRLRIIAGDGVPLIRTASWRFLRFIISSGLFFMPEAWREVQHTVFRRYFLATCPGTITFMLRPNGPAVFGSRPTNVLGWATNLSKWQKIKRFCFYGNPWLSDFVEVSQGTIESARQTLREYNSDQ